jgi:hypothetical protein
MLIYTIWRLYIPVYSYDFLICNRTFVDERNPYSDVIHSQINVRCKLLQALLVTLLCKRGEVVPWVQLAIGHHMPQFYTRSPVTAEHRICSQAVRVRVMVEKNGTASIISPTLYKYLSPRFISSVTDRTFDPYRPVSSQTRQRFCCTNSSVELKPTRYFTLF